MFSYTNLLNDLNVKIQNKSTAIPVSVRTFVNQILRQELGERDYASTIRHTTSYQAVYDDIFRYPVASDMKSEALIDIQKYSNFNKASGIKYRKVSPNIFRTMSEYDTLAFDYSDGLSWMLANLNGGSTLVLHTMDSLTDNGTWTATDNGENIVANTINYIAGNGAISCDMSALGTALSIVNSTMTAMDLTDTNKIFLWAYLPTVANLSNFTLLYGSDTANYYTTTATTAFDTNSLVVGWNLIAFDKGVATGTPDLTAVNYAKITINFSATPSILTGFLFDSLMISTGEPIEQSYYSRYPWKTSAGTWIQDSTSNEDILNATELEYAVWLNKCAYEAAKAIPLSDTQIGLLKNDYLDSRNAYCNKYPSRRIKEQTYTYRPMSVYKKIRKLVKFDNVDNAL